MRNFIVAAILMVLFVSCQKKQQYSLKKASFEPDPYIFVDTLEIDAKTGVFLVYREIGGVLGDFESEISFCKKITSDSTLCYVLDQEKQEGPRIYKKYIAFSEVSGSYNWGWFYIRDGKIMKNCLVLISF